MVVGRFRSGFGSIAAKTAAGLHGEAAEPHSGLTYVGSWVEASLGRCFQVVDCDELAALQRWAALWRHCVELELVPIVPAHDAVAALQPLLD